MRWMVDCRNHPSATGCTLCISGESDEVVRAATEHAVSVHGEKESSELTTMIRASLRPEPEQQVAGGLPPSSRESIARH